MLRKNQIAPTGSLRDFVVLPTSSESLLAKTVAGHRWY